MKFDKNMIGIVAYTFLESTIDNLVSSFAGNIAIGPDMIELALGYYLRKKSGIVGSIGNAMFIINLYNVVKSMTGGGFQLLGVTPTQNSEAGW